MIDFLTSITNPYVILYNVGTLIILLIWIFRKELPIEDIVLRGNLRNLWIFFLIFLPLSILTNIIFLPSDVDDAIISGVIAFVDNGANPYVEEVVVHLLDEGTVLGLYHYFPSDLLMYSIIYLIFGFLDFLIQDLWFVIGNFLFLVGGYIFTQKTLEFEHKRLIPSYGILTCIFLFTNSALMLFYFTIGFYFWKKHGKYGKLVGIIFYILAAGVKYVTGLLLIIHLLEDIYYNSKKCDYRKLIEDSLFYIIGGIVFLLTIIPFGIIEVLNATFIYQGDITARSEVAGIYGPILVEIALLFDVIGFYNILFTIGAIIVTLISLKMGKSTYERQMLYVGLFMFILPFYGSEFAIVPFLLWMNSTFQAEINTNIIID